MTKLFAIGDETTHVIGDPKCPECAADGFSLNPDAVVRGLEAVAAAEAAHLTTA